VCIVAPLAVLPESNENRSLFWPKFERFRMNQDGAKLAPTDGERV
jgi:hypothetical protein